MGQKILVVDDDPTILKWTDSLLSSKGYTVISAQAGREGLEKIKKEKPDLMVLDILLPDMDGYKVCQALLMNEDYYHIPIIILTVTEKALEDSITKRLNIEYIQKPADGNILIDKIEKLLADSQDPKS